MVGRFRRIRAALALLMLISGVFLTAPARATEGKPDRRGTFTATAYPTRCMAWEEGVDLARFPFTVPGEGALRVYTTDLQGDWDVWVTIKGGRYRGGGWEYGGIQEDFTVRFARSREISINACNYDGETELDIHWAFWAGARGSFTPGMPPQLHERVPVNVVFVGFSREQVDEKAFLERLPKGGRPIVRTRWQPEHLGITYAYDYDVTFTDRIYEDEFFRYVRKIGKQRQPTTYQRLYNQQSSPVETIDTNFEVDAIKTEERLAKHPPAGVDTSEYTLYFINWHGRQDFVYHVYSKTDETNTDTGYPFGNLDSQKTIAWGGTPADDPESGYGRTARVWFVDLSAGPDWRSGNYLLDSPPGRIIPPVWEYSAKGMRKPKELSADLGRITRWVAIDLLFTPSPLYPPYLTPPRLPTRIDLDMNVFEGNPNRNASSETLRPKNVLREVAKLRPTERLTQHVQDLAFEGRAAQCWTQHVAPQRAVAQGAWPVATVAWLAGSCYPARPNYSYWSNPFLDNALNLERSQDTEDADYEARLFAYSVPDNMYGMYSGLADSNQRDGTQSFAYSVTVPAWRTTGMTETVIHEYGHHFGVSHPHDGYDPVQDKHFGAYGDLYFAWLGDEVNSVMNYLATNDEFSQFDRDNVNRWLTSSYVHFADSIGQQLLGDGSAPAQKAARLMDAYIRDAQGAFSNHRYLAAVQAARRAYDIALAAADAAGLEVEASQAGWRVDDEDITSIPPMPASMSASVDPLDMKTPPEIVENYPAYGVR